VTLPGLTLSSSIDRTPGSGQLGLVPDAERFAGVAHFSSTQFLRSSGEFSMRKIIACAALAGAFLVAGCNTVEGVGKDVSSAGSTVAKTADDAK
jgi:predicted small secreted protein